MSATRLAFVGAVVKFVAVLRSLVQRMCSRYLFRGIFARCTIC